jgi:hypothetical protein
VTYPKTVHTLGPNYRDAVKTRAPDAVPMENLSPPHREFMRAGREAQTAVVAHELALREAHARLEKVRSVCTHTYFNDRDDGTYWTRVCSTCGAVIDHL